MFPLSLPLFYKQTTPEHKSWLQKYVKRDGKLKIAKNQTSGLDFFHFINVKDTTINICIYFQQDWTINKTQLECKFL